MTRCTGRGLGGPQTRSFFVLSPYLAAYQYMSTNQEAYCGFSVQEVFIRVSVYRHG